MIVLRRRSLPSRILNAPRIFARMWRLVPMLDPWSRLRFAAWQAWHAAKGF